MQTTNEQTLKDGRNFGLLISFFFAVIGLILPIIKKAPIKFHWAILCLIFLVSSFLIPKILFEIRKYWIKLGNILGHINSTIIFSLAFFLIFTPLSIFFKIIKRDLLKLKLNKYQSTWVNKNQISNFEDIF